MFSFEEYLLWESTEGAVSKVPILFDNDDLIYLIGSDPNFGHFPPELWRQALKWRYNQGMIRSILSKKTSDKIEDMGGVKLPGSRRTKGTKGSKRGVFVFLDTATGQQALIEKLGSKPDRAGIVKHHQKGEELNAFGGDRKYGYDLSDVHMQKGDNPLHFASGMPLMQEQAATDSLSSWIYGTYHKVLGEWPHMFQGKPVIPQKIKGWGGYRGIKEFPAINKNYRFLWIPEGGREEDSEPVNYTNYATPILLPGKYVPMRDDPYENMEKPKYGWTASKLMRGAGEMNDSELEHFKSSQFGPNHVIARHKAVSHKRYYVIGGWTPTNANKGENPMFNSHDDLDEFLKKRSNGKTFESHLTSEAKKGVEGFISSIRFETEGIIMSLMEDDLIEGAKQLLLKNLGDPHLGPFEYGEDDVEKIDIEKNSQNRITRAYNYAKEVSQTNVSLVGGTRRQREKWAAEGGSPKKGQVAPLVTGKGSRRWVNLTKGSEAGKGWIGSSMRYMRSEMQDLENEAKEKESDAERAKNIEMRIASRRDAISTVLEKLLKKYVMLQATWHSQQGMGQENMHINRDAALSSALGELPKELDRLGIPHSKLPKDVRNHFKPQEDWAGKTPATSDENKGIQIIDDLIEKGEVEVSGHLIKLQDLAKDDNLYDQMMHYVNNMSEISDDANEKRAMGTSLNRLIGAVDRARVAIGMPTRSQPQQSQPQASQSKQHHDYIKKMLDPSTFMKVAHDLKSRHEYLDQLYGFVKSGEISKTIADRVKTALDHFSRFDEVAGSTGVVMGVNPKVPKRRDFNIQGVPGELGNSSVEGWPIGTKEDKKEKKKRKKNVRS